MTDDPADDDPYRQGPDGERLGQIAYETFVRESGYDATRSDSVKQWRYKSAREKHAWCAAALAAVRATDPRT